MIKKKRKVLVESNSKSSPKFRTEIKPRISSQEKKLDIIIKRLIVIEKNQKILLQKEDALKKEEDQILKEDKLFVEFEKKELVENQKIEEEEKEELAELKKIENLENSIKNNLKESPLRRITYRDVTKGIIGAFFGVVGHFAFAKGPELAEHFSVFRATLLFIVSFVIILLFLYFSGFKNVKDKLFLKFFPLRAIVIYLSAIITIFVVLLLYGKIHSHMSFLSIYNMVAAISLLAVMGAATADLIGKNE